MKIWSPIAAFVAFILIWEAGVRLFEIPVYVLPAPSVIFEEGVAFGFNFVGHAIATLETICLGFAFSLLVAIPLGIAIAIWRPFSDAMFPLIVFAHAIPTIALAPIIVLSLGPGMAARVVVVALISFFPILVSTVAGLRATPRDLLDLAHVAGASSLKSLLTVELPGAVPFLFNGFRIGVTTSVIGGVVGEFVASDQGLGYLVVHSTTNFDVPRALASIVILALISLTLFQSVEWLQRWLFPWSMKGGRT